MAKKDSDYSQNTPARVSSGGVSASSSQRVVFDFNVEYSDSDEIVLSTRTCSLCARRDATKKLNVTPSGKAEYSEDQGLRTRSLALVLDVCDDCELLFRREQTRKKAVMIGFIGVALASVILLVFTKQKLPGWLNLISWAFIILMNFVPASSRVRFLWRGARKYMIPIFPIVWQKGLIRLEANPEVLRVLREEQSPNLLE